MSNDIYISMNAYLFIWILTNLLYVFSNTLKNKISIIENIYRYQVFVSYLVLFILFCLSASNTSTNGYLMSRLLVGFTGLNIVAMIVIETITSHIYKVKKEFD